MSVASKPTSEIAFSSRYQLCLSELRFALIACPSVCSAAFVCSVHVLLNVLSQMGR